MDHVAKGWLPKQLRREGDQVLCRWTFVGDTPFTAPFFEETLQRCLCLPENSKGRAVLTTLDLLPVLAAELPALEPAAIIFHVSRCGSTLLTQLLGEDPAYLTLSEVPFFDQILRARFQPELAEAVSAAALLPAALRVHAQVRQGAERHFILKADSWHIAFHAELRALYPRTPFILLYRDPSAVMDSHRKQPGMHAVPGLLEPALFGLDAGSLAALPREAYLPRVLQSYYEAFRHAARCDPGSLLLPYRADMVEAVEDLARFAGFDLSGEHRERMQIRSARHGKRPDEAFEEVAAPPVPVPGSCQASYEALEGFRRGG